MEEGNSQTPPTLKDALDAVCSFENEYIHQDIQCDNCKKAIIGVRWRCSNCEDFDLCSQCERDGGQAQHNSEHSFYQIQYHRLSLPPAGGEDLQLLQRFEQANTSESFYLHFPWFFGCQTFERLISGTPNEEESSNFLAQFEGSSSDVRLQVVLDAAIRLLAPEDWNWREVRDFAKPLLELQLVRAMHSDLFYQLYHKLRSDAEVWQSSKLSKDPIADTTLKRELYDAHLDDASAIRCKDALHTFLHAWTNHDGVSIVPTGIKNISESATYIEMLSDGFDLKSCSLPIFEEVELLLKRRKPGSRAIEWSISESMRRWEEYILTYEESLTCLDRYLDHYQHISPERKDSISISPPLYSIDSYLGKLSHLMIRRDFMAAASMLRELDSTDPLQIFLVICFYDITGHISEGCRVTHSAVASVEDQAHNEGIISFRDLFKLCEAYFCCSSKGQWKAALLGVNVALERLHSSREADLKDTNALLRCTLELFCFKIFLLAAKDRDDPLEPVFASKLVSRLRQLRHFMVRLGHHDWCLLVLEIETQVLKKEKIIYELEQSENLRHKRIFIPQARPSIEILEDFLSTLRNACCDEIRIAAVEASARVILGYVLAECDLEVPLSAFMSYNLGQAWELFEKSGSSLGQAEVALLSLTSRISLEVTDLPDWEDIRALFQSHGYFKGLTRFHELKAIHDLNNRLNNDISAPFLPTGPSLFQQILPIAKEAGDELLFRKCQVHSMRNWIEGPTFILLCENMFHPSEGILSDQLFLEASKLLSQVYEINNNFTESSAFALLHLRLAHTRKDARLLDQATMLYFRCVGNTVALLPDDIQIYEVASLALSFDRVTARFCQSILRQMEASTHTIVAGSLPINSLLWPAKLARKTFEDDGAQHMSPDVILSVYRSLKLATDFLDLLPLKFRGLFFPKISEALGIAAEMLVNPVLSLISYDLGQRVSSGSDGYEQACLWLRIGRIMASWMYYDRPSFGGLQDLTFRYLGQAADFFWGEGSRQSSYKNGLEASLVLARAHLREVQHLIEDIDWGEGAETFEAGTTDLQKTNKCRILAHVEAGLSAVRKAITGNLSLRQNLNGLPAMQAIENSRLFYFDDMEEIYWNEMGLEMDQSRLTGDPGSFYKAIQKWKAVSLRDAISQRLEHSVHARDLVSNGDTNLNCSGIPQVLGPDVAPPEFQEETIWNMAEIAETHLEEGQRIIFVDWARYYDTLFMIAYDGTEGRIRKGVVEIEYRMIEDWVRSELGVFSLHQGHTDRKRLHSFAKLKKLTPILDSLEGFVKPGDLVVFCPSGILHAVPLQAIPFGPTGKPLITSNPVVFCPSISLLELCVDRVEKTTVLCNNIPAAAFTRLGPYDPEEEARMFATAKKGLSNELLMTSFAKGTDVTRNAFMTESRGVRLLHYHGHAYLEAAQRRDRALQLEPQIATECIPQDDGFLSVMDIFNLQLDSAVVVLMACASGEDDVAPNDDPLGLLSAFLYAGASSVIATRWPTQTADARDFAHSFYKRAFSSRKDGVINLAVAMQAAVLELWDNWDEDDPYHWAQFQLYGSWFAKI